jgi:hypothetical protein
MLLKPLRNTEVINSKTDRQCNTSRKHRLCGALFFAFDDDHVLNHLQRTNKITLDSVEFTISLD